MPSLFDFYDKIIACESAEDVDLAWQAWALRLGFNRAGTMLNTFEENRLVLKRIVTNYPSHEEQTYVDENFFQLSPSSNPLRTSSRLYADHVTLAFSFDGRPRRFRDFLAFVDSLDFPGEITVAFRNSAMERHAFHVWSEEGEATFKKAARARRDTLVSAASLAAIKFDTLGQDCTNDCGLTPRETDCLLWLARGDRQQDIADRLKIDLKTVEMHLQNARLKLGARTSPQAVATAILSRQIHP